MHKKQRNRRQLNTNTFKATVKAHPHGFAFLIPEGKEEREQDFFVPAKNLCGALDKDVVIAARVKGTRDEAYVIKILSRGRHTVCGRFEAFSNNSGAVFADDHAFLSDVLIPRSLFGGAVSGDKVTAEITGYLKDGTATGKIIEVLGKDGDFFTEELSIIREAGLKEQFPEYVIATAEKVAAEEVICGNRRNLKNTLTVTIDGEDTRDMDDAVSLEVKNGKYVLGVHIADVSRYVKLSGCIEREAYERGTSVYFPDRVLPMLPPSLSNGACSLNEGEERYALSCVMTFSSEGVRESYEIFESVIASDKKLTYPQATAIIEGAYRDGTDPAICKMLKDMEALCTLLEGRQKARGGIDLDIKEAHIYLDERGEILIPECGRTISHRIIEQFMIAANQSVAEFAAANNAPFLYRVHESPSPEKASRMFGFARDVGIKIFADPENVKPADYSRILKEAEGKPFYGMLNTVMLRSMQKARYSEKNLGHFGLASKCYCHFTSPIRRYPDLFVHRVLKLLLNSNGEGLLKALQETAVKAATDSSEKERIAESAEREVDELYKFAYMQKRIGEEFEGVISGVIDSGVFVQLANTIEGMIRLDDLPYDRYRFYGDRLLLKGTRHAYRIGDKIVVKVASCDSGTNRIRFIPV